MAKDFTELPNDLRHVAAQVLGRIEMCEQDLMLVRCDLDEFDWKQIVARANYLIGQVQALKLNAQWLADAGEPVVEPDLFSSCGEAV